MYRITGDGVTKVLEDDESLLSRFAFSCYGHNLESMTFEIRTFYRKKIKEQVVSGRKRLEDLDRNDVLESRREKAFQ
jgi:hypothetical protein